MSRKPVKDGGMRDKIATAAMELILKNGYDGSSVRSIMNKAGGEIGLFYYYFKNKDDVFDEVLNLFFERYITGFETIVAHGRRNPCRIMQDFFEYIEKETANFRSKYADNLHRTVRWAIREHTLTIIEPYLRQVVDIQNSYYGIQPALTSEVATLFLTHGVGSAILHKDSEEYLKERGEIKKGISLIMGMPAEKQEFRIPYPAEDKDILGILTLLQKENDSSVKIEQTKLAKAVELGEVWVFRNQGKIQAFIIYSKKEQKIYALLVSKKYRRMGLASKLVETAAAQFVENTEMFFVLYNENASQNIMSSKFLETLGFKECESTDNPKKISKFSQLVPVGKPIQKTTAKMDTVV